MNFLLRTTGMLTATMFLMTGLALAGAEKDPLKPRVPAAERASSQKNENSPIQESQ